MSKEDIAWGVATLVGGVYWKMTRKHQEAYDDWCDTMVTDRDWNLVEEETVLIFQELLEEEELKESLGYGSWLE
jgi:hypothetical protein